MNKLSRRTHILVFVYASALALQSPQALEYIQGQGGLLWIGNSEEEGAPSPLLPVLGASIPLTVPAFLAQSSFPWTLETGLILYGTYYQYDNGRATPVELEHRDFWVQGFIADARIGPEMPLAEGLKGGFRAGLALLLRIPIPLFPDAGENFGDALGYLYGSVRFLYPEFEGFLRYRILKDFDLTLSLRAFLPLFHVWDGEGLPFYDQMMLAGLFGILYRFPPPS